jgi:hypothetical protein
MTAIFAPPFVGEWRQGSESGPDFKLFAEAWWLFCPFSRAHHPAIMFVQSRPFRSGHDEGVGLSLYASRRMVTVMKARQ